ncbi:MAG: radical SAM protein [Candidatus Omnitrophica bacterium]|nr:radical SAM protein [Candidatus Omnitrophota bacterium]
MQQSIWQETQSFLNTDNIPIHVIVEITRRCNLHCRHCYNIKDNTFLSLDQLQKITKQLRASGCLFVTLTGGEPTFHPDFIKIFTLFRQEGFDIKLITNGTLITDDIIHAFIKWGISEIGISLHGATADTHDDATGVRGSFDLSIENIKSLKHHGLPIHIKCTITKYNFGEYKDVINLAEQLGVPYLLDPVVSPGDDGSKDILESRINKDDFRKFYEEQYSQFEFDAPKNDGFPCDAGKNFGSISASGDVFPCIQMPVKLGNVFDQQFRDIWREATILKNIREARNCDFKECSQCELIDACTRCPGLAYLEEGDMFGPSRIACQIAEITRKHT